MNFFADLVSTVGIISITEQEKNRLPFDTARNVFVENEYVVELNVFHQLHCLHSLREQLYNPKFINYDEPVHFWEWHMSMSSFTVALPTSRFIFEMLIIV
jgi:hypothetical protein